MKMSANIFWLCLAALTLASCDGKSGRSAGESDARASGEILKRSVSDDMLPYDTLKSHPPLEKPRPASEGSAASAEANPTEEQAESGDAPTEAAKAPRPDEE